MTRYFLGAFVRLWGRLFKGGINKEERGRLRSIAKATAPLHGDALPPEDVPLAAAWHEDDVDKASWTGEQRVVTTFTRKHLYRGPSQRQLDAMRARQRRPVEVFAADPLTAPLAGPLAPAVIATSVPVGQEPWRLESFTQGWTKADLARILADSKETSR
jgi:hypothetical protein